MKMTFRWYGEGRDPISLKKIKQIPGMSGLMGVLDEKAAGEVWTYEECKAYVDHIHEAGLECEVIESVNVHEDIKMGLPTRDQYIANYCETIRNLAKVGVKVIIYNFMPVFDWLRTELKHKNEDGSTSLCYEHEALMKLDPKNLRLPGWDESYTREELNGLLSAYKGITHEKLFENLVYFLKGIMAACDETGIDMAIHPDDPPWDIFGLPRIVTNEKNLDRLLALDPSPRNGLTLCTGSLGASPANDIPALLRKYSAAGRIHFVHARNIRLVGDNGFDETAHPSQYGSLDMYEILKALYDTGFDGYIRPDHGRMIWGEQGRPGYGLYDRALGAVYLEGLWEAITKNASHH